MSAVAVSPRENNHFLYNNYDSLYKAGRFNYILDSLSDQTDQETFIKARTLTALGEYKQALHNLRMLNNNLQTAAIFYRCGDHDKAAEIAEVYKADSGFINLAANYLIAIAGDHDDSLGLESFRNIVNSPVKVLSSQAALELAGFYLKINRIDSARTYLDIIEPEALSPNDRPIFYLLYCRLFNNNRQFQLALEYLKKSLASRYLADLKTEIGGFVIDSLSPNLDSKQLLELAGLLKQKRFFGETIQLINRLDESDSLGIVKAWCYFGRKDYSRAAEIFRRLDKSNNYDIKAEAAYGLAVCDYRRGQRLNGVNDLLTFADIYPKHSLTPRALFTSGDFYQKSDPAKSADIFKRLIDNYQKSDLYPRTLYLLGSTYLKLGLKQQARELFSNHNIVNEQADLFDFWQYKISSSDTALLDNIIERARPTYYHFRARQQRGLDIADSVINFDSFINDFLIKAEQYLSLSLKTDSVDRTPISYADSLFDYGFETEAGRHLLYLHNKGNNLILDLALIRKSRDLNLDWVFFEVLDNFKSALLKLGYSFSRDTWSRLNYPVLYEEIINYHSNHDFDPYLALAIIRRESRFDPIAISSVGAMGLMQLMPATASQMAEIKNIPDNWMFEPGYNIKLGCKYLHWLNARLHKDEVVAAAYNAGPAAAKRWLKQVGSDMDTFIETIGYDQSRDYARWVMGDYYCYRFLWSNHF